MPQIQFTPSQGMVQTSPVQVNTQPNLTISRAFENISKATQAAAQLTGQIRQDNFQEALRQQQVAIAQNDQQWASMTYEQKRDFYPLLKSELVDKYDEDSYFGRQLKASGQLALAKFGTDLQQQGLQDQQQQKSRALTLKVAQAKQQWAGMSYQERKEYMGTLQAELVDAYDPTTAEGRRLRAAGEEALAEFGTTLFAEGVEEEYLDNLTAQNQGIIEFNRQWTQATSYDERADLEAQFYSDFVLPYEGYDDEYSRSLYNNGLEMYGQFQEALAKEKTAINNDNILTSVLKGATSLIDMEGTITSEKYEVVKKRLSGLSDYEQNKSAYNTELSNAIIQAIVNKASTMPKTWENAQAFRNNLMSFAEADPNVKGKQPLKVALNSVVAFENAASVEDNQRLNALVQNDDATMAQVVELGEQLLERGAISQEVYDANVFAKRVKNEVRNITNDVVALYNADNVDGLVDFVRNGRAATVQKVVTSNLQTELADQVEKVGATEAINNVLKKAKSFQDQGIPVGNLDTIDTILGYSKNGNIITNEDALLFTTVMASAIENDYQNATVRSAMPNYMVLRAWQRLGVQDVANRFQTYLTSDVRVQESQVKEVLDQIVDNVSWAENLQEENYNQFRAALAPAIKAGIKAGISPETMEDDWDDVLFSQYFEADLEWGTSSRLLIPKVGGINSEDIYKGVVNYFGEDATVLPADILNPTGEWVVYKDGELPKSYSYEFVDFVARTGTAPPSGQ